MLGKVCLVTGASSGLGMATALALARRGASLVLVSRSRQRGEAARDRIARLGQAGSIELVVADLSALDRVRMVADTVRSGDQRLDVLIHNAGVYRGRPELVPGRFESTMAVNYLAPFLLTNLLSEPLSANRARVIMVTCDAHRYARLNRTSLENIIRGEGKYRGRQAYADSKLAAVLFTFELARRAAASGIQAFAVDPGMMRTHLWRHQRDAASRVMRCFTPFMASPRRAAEALVRIATDPWFEDMSGTYFENARPARAAPPAYDIELADRLWMISAKLTGVPQR